MMLASPSSLSVSDVSQVEDSNQAIRRATQLPKMTAATNRASREAMTRGRAVYTQAVETEEVPFSMATNDFETAVDRSTTDVLRDDLRQWFASHDPMTLLEHQDWAWSLDRGLADCGPLPQFMTTVACRDALDSQGSDFNQQLVQYFFDNLSCIHTVLDDTAEPFKALIRRYLGSSPLLHKSVVCMAAAHCFQDEESMLPMCLECHTAAVRSLSEAVSQIEAVLEQEVDVAREPVLSDSQMLHKLEETLLASIILGFCAVSTKLSPASVMIAIRS